MNALLQFTAQNTIVALVLATCVYTLSRVWRNPPLAHVLWLLVLLKLVAPPVMRLEWTAPAWSRTLGNERAVPHASPAPREANDPEPPNMTAQLPDAGGTNDQTGSADGIDVRASASQLTKPVTMKQPAVNGRRHSWPHATAFVFWCWAGGAALCGLVAATRIARFERRLKNTLPASERVRRITAETAAKLGVRRTPEVRCVESVEVPLLWCVGRHATIVLPTRLLSQLDNREIALMLAHELAHLRRRDHWVRAVELIVSLVHWWNPLVWLVRRQLHQAEELCCDAWVRWAFPDCRKVYAEVVLKAAESLGASLPAGMPPASPFLRSLSVKARIEMILESQFKPRVSARSLCVAVLFAMLVLPSFLLVGKTEALAQKEEAASAERAESAVRSEFPYVVKFERGASKFIEGDKISILEVRGTADTFKPGEIYWIKGEYTLASHDRASLSAYTTAKNSADGTGKSYTAQSTAVKKGSGTFTLFLPMACEGWPHVSFYPADGGESFGGSYFGTGDSVLKRWWGSKETPAEDKPAKQTQISREPWRAFGRVTDVDGRPLAGVEIWAHCGVGSLPRTGMAKTGEDGRYEIDFHGMLGFRRSDVAVIQAATISPQKAGYFEANLHRQGGCVAANLTPDEGQLKHWGTSKDRVFLPGHPLELNFVMQPAASVAGRLVDEQGQPLAGYSVSLQGPDLPPSTSVVSDAKADEQGRFRLESVPTSFRYQFVVRKANPKPPWDDSWASAALRFDRPEADDLRAWLGDREIRVKDLVLRVAGPGMHGKTATRIAGNAGVLDLTVDDSADVLERGERRVAARSASLTLRNASQPDVSQSLIHDSVPAPPAVASKIRLARGRANEAGEFVISFENPSGFNLERGKHQVIFQVFVGVSRKPVHERIFRQLDIQDGRYEVPVKIAPEWTDDSRVSITFLAIQPDHDAWVKAFFDEGKGTTYHGIWTSDGDILPAIPSL